MKKKKLYLIIAAFFLTYTPITCYAGESSVNLDDGTTVIITSDGQTGSSQQNQGSETTNNSESSTSRQYTQEEKNAISYRNNIYNQIKGWYADLVNKRNNSFPYFSGGNGTYITNMTIGSLNKSAISRLLNNVNLLNHTDAPSWYNTTYNWGSLTKPSTSLEEDGSWGSLTQQEKENIRESILKNENNAKWT